jgi:hypothetical protein
MTRRAHASFVRGAPPLLLLLAACGSAGDPTITGEPGSVAVADLGLEVSRLTGATLVVRAEQATFSDLPGRSGGALEHVEVEANIQGDVTAHARADRAELTHDGRILLHQASVTTGRGGMQLTAGSVSLGPDGDISARDVSARLRSR